MMLLIISPLVWTQTRMGALSFSRIVTSLPLFLFPHDPTLWTLSYRSPSSSSSHSYRGFKKRVGGLETYTHFLRESEFSHKLFYIVKSSINELSAKI
jgi:hypothetical protein